MCQKIYCLMIQYPVYINTLEIQLITYLIFKIKRLT